MAPKLQAQLRTVRALQDETEAEAETERVLRKRSIGGMQQAEAHLLKKEAAQVLSLLALLVQNQYKSANTKKQVGAQADLREAHLLKKEASLLPQQVAQPTTPTPAVLPIAPPSKSEAA